MPLRATILPLTGLAVVCAVAVILPPRPNPNVVEPATVPGVAVPQEGRKFVPRAPGAAVGPPLPARHPQAIGPGRKFVAAGG